MKLLIIFTLKIQFVFKIYEIISVFNIANMIFSFISKADIIYNFKIDFFYNKDYIKDNREIRAFNSL